MPYKVYVNHPNNKAIIHKADCGSLCQHGGINRENGHYSPVFDNLDDAWEYAFAQGKRRENTRTHRVSSCLGELSPPERFL